MAEAKKPQLSEEEMIARKVKIRRTITYVLGAIAAVCIIAFIILALGTKENITKQTSIDTQELRSKLKMIIAIENKHFEENGKYVPFNFLTVAKDLPQYDPDLDGAYKFKFDEKTGIVTGMEKDASNDSNGDGDGSDGLTLSVNWEPGVVEGLSGGDFFWTDEDITDLQSRPKPKAPANAPADTTAKPAASN